jgi:hypothetical protein
MPLHRRPNPTDPGDAADLSTPQGICLDRWLWLGENRGNRPGRANPIETSPESNGIGPLRTGNFPAA